MAYTINISFLFYFCRRQTASQRQSTFTQPRPQPVLAKSMPVAARRPVPLPRSLSATSGATTSGAATSGAVAAGVRKRVFFFRLCVRFVLFCLFYCVEKSTLNNDLYWRKSNQNVMRLLANHNTSQRISYLDWMHTCTLPYVCFTSWLSRR